MSDVSYSVWPTIALDETTPRLHFTLTYAPGFTFYQRESSFNEADQNASIDFQYRLSPHVTFRRGTVSRKAPTCSTSRIWRQARLCPAARRKANFSVIAPIADRLSNSGNVGITYQFAANRMVGAGGTFTNLHYPDQALKCRACLIRVRRADRPSIRFGFLRCNYFGATYQYQRLVSFPVPGTNETQTHALLFFYTMYPRTQRLDFSLRRAAICR